jgi:hypothetical protein
MIHLSQAQAHVHVCMWFKNKVRIHDGFSRNIYHNGRSQWPRGLRHGCLCVYSVFVLSCVQGTALRGADHPSTESYRVKMIKKLKKRPRSTKRM